MAAPFTQSQLYEKLKGWVPSWFFQEEHLNEATFQAVAKLFEALGVQIDDHQRETFICESTAPVLDEHGRERNLVRLRGELDSEFCLRVQRIINQSNCPAIKALVDQLLINGEASIKEHWRDQMFYDREFFLNRGDVFIDDVLNQFSIIVDNQTHAPFSFFDREYFAVREDFIGTGESPIELFELIVEAVNRAKACGVLYRVIERAII